MPHFMIVLIPHIHLLNLFWIIKCLFLRNMEPLTSLFEDIFSTVLLLIQAGCIIQTIITISSLYKHCPCTALRIATAPTRTISRFYVSFFLQNDRSASEMTRLEQAGYLDEGLTCIVLGVVTTNETSICFIIR